MADQAINALPTKSAPSTGDKVLMIGTAEEYQMLVDDLATAVLNKLTSKTYNLDQGSKTLIAALNELNSKIPNGYEEDADTPDKLSGDLYIFRWNGNTLHTPYKENATSAGDGLIISCTGVAYGVQLCLVQASTILFIRSKSNSGWSKWRTIESAEVS